MLLGKNVRPLYFILYWKVNTFFVQTKMMQLSEEYVVIKFDFLCAVFNIRIFDS